jgi:PAS domain S-box-containing protein
MPDKQKPRKPPTKARKPPPPVDMSRVTVSPGLNDPDRRVEWNLPESETDPSGAYMIELNLLYKSGLRGAQARFRAMFEHSAIGIGIMGLDRKVIDLNPAMCKMLGRTREELFGATPILVTHPDDMQSSTLQYQELISGKIDHYVSERRYVRKNGEVFWGNAVGRRSDSSGKIGFHPGW